MRQARTCQLSIHGRPQGAAEEFKVPDALRNRIVVAIDYWKL
jgi:hypothetical protein